MGRLHQEEVCVFIDHNVVRCDHRLVGVRGMGMPLVQGGGPDEEREEDLMQAPLRYC